MLNLTNMKCILDIIYIDDYHSKIDILEKLPGIYSARWAGKKSNFKLAIKKVYKELDKKKEN